MGDGSQSAVLLAQLFNWTELKARSGQDSTHMGCFPSATREYNHRTSSCVLFQHCTVARRTASHVAVAAADTNIFINHHKASSRLCIAPLGQTFVHAGSSHGYRRWRDNKRTRSGARRHYLLPVAASIFINTAETDFRAKSLKSLHASSQVLQPVQRLES